MKNINEVVITGMGIVSPLGNDLNTFWTNCKAGISGVSGFDRFSDMGFKCRVAATVKDFTPPSTRLPYDDHILYALSAADDALRDAELSFMETDISRTGIAFSTAIAGTAYMEKFFIHTMQAGQVKPSLSPAGQRELLANAQFSTAASEIASRYDIRGPVLTLSTGCTGGLDALGAAIDLIKSGECDVVIAGATEAPLTPIAFAAFDIIGAMTSAYNDTPQTASRPYDRTRSGFVLGEGCGVFILENKAHAVRRQAKIYASLVSMASTCNAFHMTNLDSQGTDLARAMTLSLNAAEILPEQVDYINAHGSSTPQNDVNETSAIKAAFGDHARRLSISSLKSVAGHALAAANMIESVAAVLSVAHQETTPSMNIEHPDPQCDLRYAGNDKLPVHYAMKNASGFSGIHSAIILKKHTDCHHAK